MAEQAANMYSMVLVPLYDTLGKDACKYICNQSKQITFYIIHICTKFVSNKSLMAKLYNWLYECEGREVREGEEWGTGQTVGHENITKFESTKMRNHLYQIFATSIYIKVTNKERLRPIMVR